MNQKELNEIRRRFRLDKNNFSRIFGCYVNSNREVISWIDASLGLMRQEEQEMYLGLLKKTLSGTLGRNLIDIEFSTAQVADSDEHRLLQTLRQTECKDVNARETLCRKIIESLSMGETISFSSPPTPMMFLTAARMTSCRRTPPATSTSILSAPSAL